MMTHNRLLSPVTRRRGAAQRGRPQTRGSDMFQKSRNLSTYFIKASKFQKCSMWGIMGLEKLISREMSDACVRVCRASSQAADFREVHLKCSSRWDHRMGAMPYSVTKVEF